MTFAEVTACCRSHQYFLETCIDGNACKENAADERWVGNIIVLTQPLL